MKLLKSTLLGSLAALTLIGCANDYDCADDQCHIGQDDLEPGTDYEVAPDMVYVDIEVAGRGQVMVDDGSIVTVACDQLTEICSVAYPRGTRLEMYADGEFSEDAGWEDACNGFGSCEIVLDDDKVLIANFESFERKPGKALAEVGPMANPDAIADDLTPFPGEPDIIVDVFPTPDREEVQIQTTLATQ